MNAGAMAEAPGGNVSVGKLSRDGTATAGQGFSQIFAASIQVVRVSALGFSDVAVAVATGGKVVIGELSQDGRSNTRQIVSQVAVTTQVVRKKSLGVSAVAAGSSSLPVAVRVSRVGARAVGNEDGAVTVPGSGRRRTGQYSDQVVVSVQVVRARRRSPGIGVDSSIGRLPALHVGGHRGRASRLTLCSLPGDKATTESTVAVWRVMLRTPDTVVRRAGATPKTGAGRAWSSS